MKTNHLLIAFAILFGCQGLWAATSPKREFRATWLATVQNIDWPGPKTTNATAQKAELTTYFDQCVAGGLNACCFQVRSLCDALYRSSYEPWGACLTGTRGKDPGYDPLAFAIEEAHKRGLELHVWVNPFRVTSAGSISTSDKVYQNCKDYIIKYNNGSFSGQILDPGNPNARAYVIKVLMEIINNYDVDGILMDDYFYPYGGTTDEDAVSKAAYKPASMDDGDWRRENVNKTIRALYDSIQAVKPWVRFGMGPFGIWTMQSAVAQKYGISLPQGIVGLDDYDVQACNPVEWVKGGYVDYIAPQLYWSSQIAAQSYSVLNQWWAQDVCQHFSAQLPGKQRVDFFASQAAYHAYDGYRGYDDGVVEIQRQIDFNRQYTPDAPGSVFYNTNSYVRMYAQLHASHFAMQALPPAMDWKAKTVLPAPTNLTLSGNTLTWSHPSAQRFTVYAFPKSVAPAAALSSAQYLLGVVYGNSYDLSAISNLTDYTLAVCAYDRYGVEYEPATYTTGQPDITWVLNGGTVSVPVPTNAELWEAFKPYYNTYYSLSRFDQPIDKVSTFAADYMQDIMTNTASEYKWLGDYVAAVATAQGYTLDSESAWRWAVHAFFNCSPANSLAVNAPDFTTAGQPSAWGNAYQLAHGGAVLPSSVSETYTLPTPTKEGTSFLGWYDNPKFSGTPIVSIPAGFHGTLYARFADTPIATDDIVWILNGGVVSTPIPTNAELWELFMPYYNTYYAGRKYIPRTSQSIDKVSGFCYPYGEEIMTDAASEYKWLGDYINTVATAQGYTLNSESAWRWALHAFFNCSPANSLAVNAPDFTVAGQPKEWGKTFQNANPFILPTSVDTEYTLPTPIKTGSIFLGWYDNSLFSGSPVTSIPAGWVGSLYAKWNDIPTDADALPIESSLTRIFDTMGRFIGTDIEQLPHGLFIVVQGNKVTKIIR